MLWEPAVSDCQSALASASRRQPFVFRLPLSGGGLLSLAQP
jgi:hypothetical protein